MNEPTDDVLKANAEASNRYDDSGEPLLMSDSMRFASPDED